MRVNSATPVFLVDRVEASRDFFKRAGFEVTVEIPAGNAVGFALLVKDGVQMMLQTRGNEHEPPSMQVLTRLSRHAAVFIEVDDVAAVVGSLAGEKVVVERHTTFYGSDELTYQEPGGNFVTFAQFATKK
jgi:hypothetical protein